MPAAERQQESGAVVPVLQPGGVRITGRIPGLVPGRESGLTWAGEPLKGEVPDTPEPRDKLGAHDGERTEDVALEWDAVDWRPHEDNVAAAAAQDLQGGAGG